MERLRKIWKTIEHHRYTVVAPVVGGLIWVAAVGCTPMTASPLDDAKLVNTGQLSVEFKSWEAKQAIVAAKFEAAGEDLTRQAEANEAFKQTLLTLASGSVAEDEIIHSLPMAESSAIVCSEDTPVPALLKATRLNTLFDQMKERFSYIIIDAPAIDAGIETEYLAQFADVALYVVQSGKMNIFKEKKIFKKLEETNVTVIGSVLTDVQKLYERV